MKKDFFMVVISQREVIDPSVADTGVANNQREINIVYNSPVVGQIDRHIGIYAEENKAIDTTDAAVCDIYKKYPIQVSVEVINNKERR